MTVPKVLISAQTAVRFRPYSDLPQPRHRANITRSDSEDTALECALSVVVRDATADYMLSCRMCLDAVAQEGRWLSQLRASSVASYTAFWTFLREAKAPHVVAVEDAQVVGWCDIIPDTTPVRSHVGSLGMGLLASHRGQGFGRQLLTQTLVRACERGLERVELAVLHDNTAARTLYERVGFVPEGRLVRDWKHQGIYRDSILMAARNYPAPCAGWISLIPSSDGPKRS